MAVELHHPVEDDLHGHAPEPSQLAPGRTLVDGSELQKTPGLRPILRPPRRQAARVGVEIPRPG